MGASFRNVGQITELAGCDRLTISPALLDELAEAKGDLPKKLDASKAATMDIEKIEMNEKTFRWMSEYTSKCEHDDSVPSKISLLSLTRSVLKNTCYALHHSERRSHGHGKVGGWHPRFRRSHCEPGRDRQKEDVSVNHLLVHRSR